MNMPISLSDSARLDSSAYILSGKGMKFEIPLPDQDKLCLLSDGMLYVAQSYQTDMVVLSYMELLRRNKMPFTVKIVTVDEIQRLHGHAHTLRVKQDNTFRQTQVVTLIREGVKRRASDIHFRNYERHTEIWMRIDGFLEKSHVLNSEDGMAMCGTMYGSMCDVADPTYELRKSQDGRLKRQYLNSCGLHGARIATRPMEYGNIVVLRLLYNAEAAPSLHNLGYLQEQILLISRMTNRTTGINIFSGPTGSGKSTSLKILLSQLLTQFNYHIHLLTIEDPPEYMIEGAVQTPILCDKDVPEEVARAWVKSISNAMRLDPDTIMIGEMRDHESAVTAFRAAMTGHGVWTTLHANNAIQILDRLRDMQVDLSFITDASLMTGLINQSLVPLNCDSCKRPYLQHADEIEPTLRARIEQYCQPEKVLLKGTDKGCAQCGGKGYMGRHAVAECIIPDQKMMNLYKTSGASAARSYWVKEKKGITKCAHLIHYINQGLVDPLIGEQKVCALDEDLLTLTLD
jgi:type II secretory ATPase GspE/PulE/Tfp pilus assembly ATPase PilB-like protein